jgi:hypothetical protein
MFSVNASSTSSKESHPKQLESGTLSTDHPRHFNQNAPIVFER